MTGITVSILRLVRFSGINNDDVVNIQVSNIINNCYTHQLRVIHRLQSEMSCPRQKRPVVHVYEVSDGPKLRFETCFLEVEMTTMVRNPWQDSG